MQRIHFFLDIEDIEYIDKIKIENDYSSRNKAIIKIINEHRNRSDYTIKSMYEYIANMVTDNLIEELNYIKNDISKDVSSNISPQIKKLKQISEWINKDNKIILQLLNGIYYKEDYGIIPDIERQPSDAYTLSVKREEDKIAKEHYKKSNTLD